MSFKPTQQNQRSRLFQGFHKQLNVNQFFGGEEEMYMLIDSKKFLGFLKRIVDERANSDAAEVWDTDFIEQIENVLIASRMPLEKMQNHGLLPSIKDERVVFSGPVTTVIQPDKSKTSVRCAEGDEYDAKYGYLLAHFMIAYGMTRTQVSKLLQKVEKDALRQHIKARDRAQVRREAAAERVVIKKQKQAEIDEIEVLEAARENYLQRITWWAVKGMLKRTNACPQCQRYYCLPNTPCTEGRPTPQLNCSSFAPRNNH